MKAHTSYWIKITPHHWRTGWTQDCCSSRSLNEPPEMYSQLKAWAGTVALLYRLPIWGSQTWCSSAAHHILVSSRTYELSKFQAISPDSWPNLLNLSGSPKHFVEFWCRLVVIIQWGYMYSVPPGCRPLEAAGFEAFVSSFRLSLSSTVCGHLMYFPTLCTTWLPDCMNFINSFHDVYHIVASLCTLYRHSKFRQQTHGIICGSEYHTHSLALKTRFC